ncbi:MAG: hypothetical protein WCR65_03820 [Parcubacteria group bacterium]|jgi:hypothetical protein
MMEIEAMRCIDPIGGELQPVSRPPKRAMDAAERDRVMGRMFPKRKKSDARRRTK